ncbi:MAG: hypothetical protein AAFX09_03300 [Pseudomonadota bacterium]
MSDTPGPTRWMKAVMLSSALAAVTTCAHAQEPPVEPASEAEPASAETTQPAPCSSDAHRAFDFWAGRWSVYTPAGDYQGFNVITPSPGGCALHEDWFAGNGGTGQSISFVDQTTGQWRQIWISPEAQMELTGGIEADGHIVMAGEAINRATGVTSAVRASWLVQPEDRVHQHIQRLNPETQVWEDVFAGVYISAGEEVQIPEPQPQTSAENAEQPG